MLPLPGNRVVCVAGMHRSGTSMVAELLSVCGVYLGPEDELVPADENNAHGYWEHTGFVAINNSILGALGGGWDIPPTAISRSDAQPTLMSLRIEAARFLQRFAGRAAWGWKDPRTSLTWPFWKSLVPELKLVICIRNPLEVAESLAKRGMSSAAFSLRLWLAYNQRLLSEVPPDERVVTHYASFFCDARAELRRLVTQLQLSASDEDIERACAAIVPALRHTEQPTATLLQGGVSDDILQTYFALCAEAGPIYHCMLAQEPEPAHQPAAQTLTPVHEDYATALQVARLRGQVDVAREELTRARARSEQALGDLAAQLQQKQQALADLTAQLPQKDQALVDLAAQLRQKDQTLDDLATRLQQKDQALDDLVAQLQQKDQALDNLVAQLQQKDQALDDLAAQLQQKDQVLSMFAGRLTDAQRALDDRDASAADQERVLTLLAAQLKVKERNLTEMDQDRIAFENRAHRLEAELVNIEQSRAWRLVQRWYKLRFGLRQMGAQQSASAASASVPPPNVTAPARDPLAPKILFVSHDARRHGAQILLLLLLRWLKQNTQIPFEILLKGEGELQSDFERLAPVTLWPPSQALPTQALLDHYRDANIQLVYSNTITNGAVLELLSQLQCPIICHVHELDFWINNRTEPGNNRSVKAHTTHYIAVSQAVKHSLIRNLDIPAERIDVIYGFVVTHIDASQLAHSAEQTRQLLSLPAAALVIGAAGTSDWRKGPDLFLLLARAVMTREPTLPIHFVWLGGDPAGAAFAPLQYDISHLGLADRIHFVGTRDNPLDYLTLYDVFALVSREDPFPLVSLEAASLGKPVVCFAGSGGAPEFVEADCGFVVPYLDIDAMADRCLELLRAPGLRQTLGQNAAEKVRQRHDVDVIGPQVVRMLARFLPVADRDLPVGPDVLRAA